MRSSSVLSVVLLFTAAVYHVRCQEKVFLMENPASPDEQQGGFSSHIVALRPDYTFWKMMNVLKSVFDTRTTEKRRGPIRREADDVRGSNVGGLRSRRLLLNFGRYRV